MRKLTSILNIAIILFITGCGGKNSSPKYPYQPLSQNQAGKLWSDFSITLLKPGYNTANGVDLMNIPPRPKELQNLSHLFESNESVKYGNFQHFFYGYPFDALESSHPLLAPNVISSVLRDGRPNTVEPIKALDESIFKPDALRKFLQKAVVEKSSLDKFVNDTNNPKPYQLNLIVTDDLISFEVPYTFSETTGWRISSCDLVNIIIEEIAKVK